MNLGLGLSICSQRSTASLDPSTLAFADWNRATFAGAPWAGVASAGTSGARALSSGGVAPGVGAALNGFDTASFVPGSIRDLSNGYAVHDLRSDEDQMSDEKPPMPAQPSTTQLPAVPAWAIELTRSVKDGFTRIDNKVDDGFAEVDANIKLVTSSVKDIEGRVGNLEEARRLDEQRVASHSLRVRSVSENDLSQDSKLADVIVWQNGVDEKLKALADKPDTTDRIIEEVKSAAKTPTGQKLVGGAATVLLLALTLLAASLKTKVDTLESRPALVQPAPTVYVTLPADAGAK